jgi:hypothetical protein
VQLHATGWHIRYTAGVDRFNWGTKFVAAAPPQKWAVVTCDLYKDFGERTITGIALTAFGGRAAYFDHVYVARSIDDLDRIDATGLRGGKPARLSAADLDRLWGELAGGEGEKAYLAFWRLRASPGQAVPFLKRKLAGAGGDAAKIRRWIRDLDDDAFAVREAASKALEKHLDEAAPLLEEALAGDVSAEVRSRIKRLLGGRRGVDVERERVEKAVRVLEFTATPEALRCLRELAKGADGSRAALAARAALKRLPRGE